ncbi:hypothetical protein QEH56_21165 [Pelagicoccus enzymogenes]|uniref:hypothetical protein n=1 Tax=Pelagicoccus enzymogenes TaxID=2773457 RepID=UPI00280C4AFA|nr:hypothetical protein [Pelagicoccus enzymogenes]MDQ8200691.1 hypothetical protein [Pelagicoccus enzymogenes]
MPTAQEYNTYVSPVGRSMAFKQAKESLATQQQNREFDAELQPYRMHDARINQATHQQKLDLMNDRLQNTNLSREIMTVAPLEGGARYRAITELASKSETPQFWGRALHESREAQDQMFNGLLNHSYQMGYLKPPEQPNTVNWQTQQVTGPDGQPAFVQINPQTGETRPVQGDYMPPPKSGESIYVNPETGTVEITRGVGAGKGGNNSRSTQGKIEQKLMTFREQLQMLDQLDANFDPNALTYKGKLSNAFMAVKEKAGMQLSPEEQEKQASIIRFTQGIEQLFNAYRKEITGAAASVQELDRLKASMINKDLGPTQFKAAYDQFRNQIQQGMTLYSNMLENGVSPETAARAVDEQFKASKPEESAMDLNTGTGEALPKLDQLSVEDLDKLTPEQLRALKEANR